jgi:hypothetical protein
MFYVVVIDQTKPLPLFLGLFGGLAVRFFAALVRDIPASFPLLLPLLVGFLPLLVGFLSLLVGFFRLRLVDFLLLRFLDGCRFLGFPFLPYKTK